MTAPIRRALLASAALSFGCASATMPVITPASQRDAALPAITALQRGSFDEAEKLAQESADADADNPYALLVRAIVRYKKAQQQLAVDGRTVIVGGLESGSINQKYLHTTFADAESELAAVERDLAAASRHKGLSLELCLACWEGVDWNGNGRIDERDQMLLQIERDEQGNEIPEGDPRRKPTFRFDDGDVAWARAFVSFERAALDVLLAYDWSAAASILRGRGARPSRIVVRLVEPDRIAQAKQRLLEGLDQSDAARRAYLAETDDDREWVPSPRQKSHPMPLPVDETLYATWEGVVSDVRALVRGDEGLHVADALTVIDARLSRAPRGYLDVGRMLSQPKDIVIDLDELKKLERSDDVEGMLASVLGAYYVHDMKASRLPLRLQRMKQEVDGHKEELGHKLRYLFWLN